jgi:hypothetical protein
MKKLVITLLFVHQSFGLFSSPQMPDYIIFGKDTIPTYNLILELYLQKQDTGKIESLFGLAIRDNASLNCWRGYQAIYKVENDSLFLVEIIRCGELQNKQIDRTLSVKKIKTLFGEKMVNEKVYINWFSGVINFPLTNKTLRWDGVFYKIFEKERIITVSQGIVTKIETAENYIHVPNGIDRRDKNKISDIMFKKLKRANWKNDMNYDCSDKYLITINEDGKVSKVRMQYTDEEIEKYYDKDEYDICINKIYNILKSLRFDIIKDKGKPISEDIYLEISIEDNGKIENWTR